MSSTFEAQTKIPDMNGRGHYQQTVPTDGDFFTSDHDQQPPSYEEAAGPSTTIDAPDHTLSSPRAGASSNTSETCRSRCGGSKQRSTGAIAKPYEPQAPMSAYGDDNAKWDAKLGEPGCCFSESGACCFSSRGACCFSDRGACCFSDREGCCFSDRQGCCFSDRKGCCFSDEGSCCNGNSRGSTGTCC